MSDGAASVPGAADRNLLFGIVALQMNFISRDALVNAMHAWILDKTKPLGHILCEQGQLSAERRALLDALLAEHLKAHGGDAQRSLQALSSVSSVKPLLAPLADEAVQASLAHVGAADPHATTDEHRRPMDGVRYRVLRPHARGGLGEVFVAEDTELHREVALKEIQPQHAHDAHSRGRFVMEAEITGGLEHPGIVPVYGLGTYADGRPFYAMRLIKGDNLKEAIERFHHPSVRGQSSERNLEFRQLLRRFVDVCNAVAYAHSRGVLHRDLKPGNVMLGKYGETLLVDWGLAKPIGRGVEAAGSEEATLMPSSGSGVVATVAGSVIGTPAFMSPEQAAGRLHELSAASDVYSLGATLYAVLTGKAPFASSDPGELLRKVERGELVPPRQVNPSVPVPLDAVCRKAMALQPSDRYPTALALAADVEHWLADEPVSAHREPWTARAGRWMRKHRTAVAASVAALLAITVSLAVATGLLSAKNEAFA